jgi:hypothetical protein
MPNMSATSTASEPVFPLDLEREIFKMTAQIYPSTRKDLVLVAKRVQTWSAARPATLLFYANNIGANLPAPMYRIEPSLYERVVLRTPNDHQFARTIRAQPLRFAKYVKTLHITWTVEQRVAREVLATCRYVGNLSFMVAHDKGYWPLLSNLRLRRLSIRDFALSTPISKTGFHSPFFQNITHLHLIGQDTWIRWPLSSLPSLTHLAIEYTPDTETDNAVSDVLSNAQNLQKLVALVDGDDSFDDATSHLELRGIQDPRFIVLEQPKSHEGLDVWENIAEV